MSSVKSKSHGDALLVIVILLMVLVIALVSASAVIKKPELAKYVVPAFAVAASVAATLLSRRKAPGKTPILAGLPRLWELFPYILSRKIRREVYEPFLHELLEDYLLAKRNYRSKWARQWLTFCFCLRTGALFVGSIKAALGDRIIMTLEKLVPRIVHWWLRQ